MEIELYAESTELPSLYKTLPHVRDLGITRIERSTGGQNSRPFLDVEALLGSEVERGALLEAIAVPGLALSALNTPGLGHDALWWRGFFIEMRDFGYDNVASIQNEDPHSPGIAGVERSGPILKKVI